MKARPIRIVVHERIATWTGQLRPRFPSDGQVQWVESRSEQDLVAAAAGPADSIVLIDLGGRTLWGMRGLDALNQVTHAALILVLNPDSIAEIPLLARELGATLVWSGVVVPPQVEALLHRWLRLIATRTRTIPAT